MRKEIIGVSMVFLMAVGAGPASADKCNGAKVKAIGKKESALLSCSGKEATKDGVEPACNDKASLKFSAKYNKPTGCVPGAPSETTCENSADACQSAIRALLPDGNGTTPSKCEAARLKASGKLASGELGCVSKAAAKALPIDPACISKARGKFAASFTKVSGCTGDGNTIAVQTSVETNCVNPQVQASCSPLQSCGATFVMILCGGMAPTTTTSSTTTTVTTTTNTTTTTTLGPCCGVNPMRLSFTTGIGTGNCGTVQLSNGSVSRNLACSGLFTGGGGNTVPLPYNVPDNGTSLTAVSGCNGGTGNFNLGNLTSAQTGSIRNCTSVGCLFGPPLPIPNATSTPTSVCVINVVATNASGTGNCNTGTTHLSLPLSSVLYLDGDLFPLAPGIQVCPVCNHTCTATGPNTGGPCNTNADCGNASCLGPATPAACCTGMETGTCTGTCGGGNTCHGGPNDGQGCMPADSLLGTTNSFPTSHDCNPPALNNIGSLPIAFDLTTGTTSKTAASNIGSGQANGFCGYCRDGLTGPTGTGCFAGDQTAICPAPRPASPIACTPATQATDCPAEYPDCVEKTGGAFGPGGNGAHTITETGAPAGNMTDGAGHASKLASIFCIQPTFNATVDAAGDLPGPGGVTLSGTAQLLP